jgi:hypothetical protein
VVEGLAPEGRTEGWIRDGQGDGQGTGMRNRGGIEAGEEGWEVKCLRGAIKTQSPYHNMYKNITKTINSLLPLTLNPFCIGS